MFFNLLVGSGDRAGAGTGSRWAGVVEFGVVIFWMGNGHVAFSV